MVRHIGIINYSLVYSVIEPPALIIWTCWKKL